MKMREDLVQDENYSVIYGDFHGEYQELFRCPRVQDDRDLRRFVDEYRCILGFEADNETSDLRTLKGYLGYYRLYFIDRWYGSWMDDCINNAKEAYEDNPDMLDVILEFEKKWYK